MGFNGFISYSHAADGQLAPAIQRGLHRLAKPWHRRRALWIFRDQTGLAVTPTLWTSIQKALDGSDYFVLLASPEAAQSPWVNREIHHWITTKSADRVLPVVTDGHWQWDPTRQDFTADSTAVPAALRGVFTEEPLYLDLRWARDDRHLSLRHSRFRDAIAQLAAPMHGVSKDDLEGEDVRQHRRAQQLRSGALATFVVLMLVASLTGGLAVRNAEHARTAAAEALRQQQSAFEQRGHAERSADEALRQQRLAEQQQARAVAATRETERQERLAGQQRALAQQATADADEQKQLARDQRALAELASLEADRQERLARQQQASAKRASADAARQQQIASQQRGLASRAQAQAQKLDRLAQRQQALARTWTAEADRQEKSAREQKRLAAEAAADARRQQRNAQRQRDIAVGRRLLNEARSTIDNDPRTALMLGKAADAVQADAEARRQLAALVSSTRYASTLDGVHMLTFGNGSLAAGREGDTFSLWNVADMSKPVRVATLRGDGASDTLAFSRDGRILAGVGSHGATLLWNVADPRRPVRLGTLPGLTDVATLAFSPDGRTLFTGIVTEDVDSSAVLWDVADPTRPRRLFTSQRTATVEAVTFSPDGRTMVITDEMMEVWDLTDRARPKLLTSLESQTWKPTAFSPTRPILLTEAHDATAADVWDLARPAQPRRIARLALPAVPVSLAFTVDGRTLAVGDQLGTVTRWDISEPAQPAKLDSMATNDGFVTAMSYRRDGRTLVTSGNDGSTLWTTTAYGAPVATGELTGEQVTTVTTAFRPDGRAMATAHGDGTAVFWDVTRPGSPVRRATVSIHGEDVEMAAFSRDLRTVAAAGLDQRVTLTDVSDPQRPKALATLAVADPGAYPGGVSLSPDGRTLAVASEDGVLTLWDLTDRARPRRLVTRDLADPVTAAVFGPDGRTLALTHRNGKVVLWNVANRSAPVRLSQVGFSWVEPAVFSLQGKLLVTRGKALQTAALWDIADPARPRPVATLGGHADTFSAAGFSPDGRTLAMSSQDGMVTMWDVSDRSKPLRLATTGPDIEAGTALTFSPDGRTLAAYLMYRDKPGRIATLWDYTKLKDLRDHSDRYACTIAGRGLDADEWARHIPELAYRRTCAR